MTIDKLVDGKNKPIYLKISSDGLHKMESQECFALYSFSLNSNMFEILLDNEHIKTTYVSKLYPRKKNKGYKLKGYYECQTYKDNGVVELKCD